MGSMSSMRAVPLMFFSDKLLMVALIVVSSPTRTKRGKLGCTINSRAAVTKSSNVPYSICLVCANARKCQRVRLSGNVKLTFTRPKESVRRLGWKKAVSVKCSRNSISSGRDSGEASVSCSPPSSTEPSKFIMAASISASSSTIITSRPPPDVV